jgi:hypothetical protein
MKDIYNLNGRSGKQCRERFELSAGGVYAYISSGAQWMKIYIKAKESYQKIRIQFLNKNKVKGMLHAIRVLFESYCKAQYNKQKCLNNQFFITLPTLSSLPHI